MICESHIVKEEIVFRFRKFRVSICIFLYLIVICDQMLLFMKGLVTNPFTKFLSFQFNCSCLYKIHV